MSQSVPQNGSLPSEFGMHARTWHAQAVEPGRCSAGVFLWIFQDLHVLLQYWERSAYHTGAVKLRWAISLVACLGCHRLTDGATIHIERHRLFAIARSVCHAAPLTCPLSEACVPSNTCAARFVSACLWRTSMPDITGAVHHLLMATPWSSWRKYFI